MWRFIGPGLTNNIGPFRAPVTRTDGNPSGPLLRVRYSANAVGAIATQRESGVGLTIPVTSATVTVVVADGRVLTPAANVADPQPGEFVHNPFTGTITVTPGPGFPFSTSTVVTAIGADHRLQSETVGTIPAIARQLGPTLISLEWGLSLGEHPSGSLVVGATDATLPALLNSFHYGAELTLLGIGFRCGQKSITTEKRRSLPGGGHTVTIPLEGRWENYMERPYTWRSLGQLSGSGSPDAIVRAERIQAQVDFADMAIAVGARYLGPQITIQAPQDAAPGESTTLATEFSDDWLRINGSVPDFDSPVAIRMKPIRTGREWNYRAVMVKGESVSQNLGEVLRPAPFVLSPQALLPGIQAVLPETTTPLPTPSLREEAGSGIVITWENVRVTGQFSEPPPGAGDGAPTFSSSPGRDRWVQRRPEKETKIEGEENASSPPTGAVRARSTSLNFDQSGPTKTRVESVSENGFLLVTTTWRYGYAMLGSEINTNSTPAANWRLIEFTQRRRLVDRQTGYSFGWNTQGWKLARFKTESTEDPETADTELSAEERELYRYRRIPVVERERQLLRQFRTFYDDFDDSDQRGEIIKVTLPDGSESIRYLRNPNYAEAFFVAAESKESVAFMSRPNLEPDTPPLISGSESYNRMIRHLYPGKKRIFRGAGREQPGDRSPDRYAEYSVEFSSQDASYGNSLEDAKITDHEGRPPMADRRPPEFIREEPPEQNNDGDRSGDEATQLLRLLNSGPAPNYLGPQINYPAAVTLEQALVAARTDATLENLREGTQETLELPWNADIRPGHRLTYLMGGEVRRRFVMAVQFKPDFSPDGSVNGTITVTLSRWVDAGATLRLTTLPLPSDSGSGNGSSLSFTDPIRRGFEIGEVLPPSVRSRVLGNY